MKRRESTHCHVSLYVQEQDPTTGQSLARPGQSVGESIKEGGPS